MVVAFIGGSFNPPHIAHILICKYVIDKRLAERVLLVPCASHPLGKNLAPFRERYEMCKLASAEFGDRVIVSDIEQELGGVSTTIKTIKTLIAQNPTNRYHIVIGSDILAEKEKWKNFNQLSKLAPPIVYERVGYSSRQWGKEYHIVKDACLPELSSSEIRKRVIEKRDISALVHPAVRDFILKNKIYQAQESALGPTR